MNIQSEEKVWQREVLKERKDAGEDMIKMFSIKRMPPHFLSSKERTCAKKEKIRLFRGSTPGGAIGENKRIPQKNRK